MFDCISRRTPTVVHDITENNEISTYPKKRKLPDWLNSFNEQQEDFSNNKHQRTDTPEETGSCSRISPTNFDKENVINTSDESTEVHKNTYNSDMICDEELCEKRTQTTKELSCDRVTSLTQNNSVLNNDDANPTEKTLSNIQKNVNSYSYSLRPRKELAEKIAIKKEVEKTTIKKTTPGVASRSRKTKTSSKIRVSCKYGVRCCRRNPKHRIIEAHPSDNDYRRPNYPTPPKGTPDCRFGDLCYRRNPIHFRDFSHPP